MHQSSLSTNGIAFHLIEPGAGPPILLLQGLPEFGYAWLGTPHYEATHAPGTDSRNSRRSGSALGLSIRSRFHWRRRLLVAICALLSTTACQDQSAATDMVASLNEVQRYGSNELADSGWDSRTQEYGGPILSDIAGVTVDPSRSVYVLDRDLKKIAVFQANGEFDGLILGGSGKGPGEFSLPIHMSSGDAERISVLDFELGRVTFFEQRTLSKIEYVAGAPGWRHVTLGDTVFVTRSADGHNPIVTSYVDGRSIGEGPLLAAEDRAFGAPIGIASTPDGVLRLSTRRPGVWMERRDGEWLRIGEPLFPDAGPPTEEVLAQGMRRVTPSQFSAASIAVTGDGLVLQGYTAFPQPFDWSSPPKREEISNMIAVFTADGRHLTSVEAPAGITTGCMIAGPAARHIYLCETDPFPQVIEYELDIRRVPHDAGAGARQY